MAEDGNFAIPIPVIVPFSNETRTELTTELSVSTSVGPKNRLIGATAVRFDAYSQEPTAPALVNARYNIVQSGSVMVNRVNLDFSVPMYEQHYDANGALTFRQELPENYNFRTKHEMQCAYLGPDATDLDYILAALGSLALPGSVLFTNSTANGSPMGTRDAYIGRSSLGSPASTSVAHALLQATTKLMTYCSHIPGMFAGKRAISPIGAGKIQELV